MIIVISLVGIIGAAIGGAAAWWFTGYVMMAVTVAPISGSIAAALVAYFIRIRREDEDLLHYGDVPNPPSQLQDSRP